MGDAADVRVLLAGESWVSHTIHVKGFDSFTTSEYAEGASWLITALESGGAVVSRILWVKHGGRNGPRGAQEVDQGGDQPAHPGRGQGRHRAGVGRPSCATS